MPRRSILRLVLAVIPALNVAAPGTAVGADPPPRDATASVAYIVRTLTLEARQARGEQRLPRAKADFAESFPDEVNLDLLAARLVRPVSRDPFIDAYVRWQLTGFHPPLPEMTEPEYGRFLNDLPALLDNPRADARVMREFQRIAGEGELIDRDVQHVSTMLDELAERDRRAGDLNLPALKLREWIVEQLPEDGPRTLLATVERAAATVEAGWDVTPVTRELDQRCTALADARSVTDEHRRRITSVLRKLLGARRMYLSSARLEGNRLAVSFSESAIHDFDVSRWLRLIE